MNHSTRALPRAAALLLAAAVTLLLAMPMAAPPAGAAATATIQGTVIGVNDDPSGANTYHGPLAGMRASAINASTGTWVRSVYTDTNGIYKLTGLPAATYKVKLVKTGWLTTTLPGTALAAGQTKNLGTTVINAEAVISGEVLSWMDPLDGARVTVFNAVTGKGVAAVQLGEFETTYRIGQLPPGSYKVRATKPGYTEGWADNATSYGRATAYQLVAGQHLAQTWDPMRLYIDLAPQTTLRGQLLGLSDYWDDPIPGVRVSAIDVETGAWVKSVYSTMEGEYNYVISGLPPGTYTLKFVRDGWLTTTAGPFSRLAGGTVDVPLVTMYGEVTISGQVLSGMDPIPGPAKVTVFNATTGKGVAAVMTDDDGDYTVRQLPAGSYKVRATKTGYYENWANNAPNYGLAKTYTLGSGMRLVQTWDPIDLYLDLTPINP